MNETDLRAARPPERRLPADRRSEIKEMLMGATRKESPPPPALPTRRRRRRVAGGVAVALAVAGLGTAAAATVLNRARPDAREAATVNDEIGSRSRAAEVHLEGWRPELSAERVECILPNGSVDTPASEFPLDDMLTKDTLVQECVAGNDLARNTSQPLASESATVCVNTGAYPKPVVLVDGSRCDDHPRLRTLVDTDLDELNRLRSFDVSFLAVPSGDGCPDLDTAVEWARTRIAEFGGALRIDVMDEGVACYRGVTDWTRQVVTIQALGTQP